jgi:multifunctional cyclase/dehydratase/O-methyltransferase
MRFFLRRLIGNWVYRFAGGRARFPSLYWLIHTNWISRCVYVAAELDIAERIRSQGKTTEELALECGASPAALGKVLRLLGAFEVFKRDNNGHWRLGRHGGSLLDDSGCGMKHWALTMGRECWLSAGPFVESVRQNKSGFVLHHGETLWEYYDSHPQDHEVFIRAQADFTLWHAPRVVRSFNFGKYKRVVDVGGGRAVLGMEIAKTFPQVDVTVVDRADTAVIATANIKKAGLEKNCRAIGGNFLEALPADADLYIIKHVLRDWPDEGAAQILRTVRKAIKPTGQLMVIEGIASPSGEDDPLISLMDIQLFGDMGGGLRGFDHWKSLLEEGGFEIHRVLKTEIPDGTMLLAKPRV